MAEIVTRSLDAIINGENAFLLDIADRGLHYGDGVFTTLSIEGGVPIFLDRHLARLQDDARRLDIPFPGISVLRREVWQLCMANPDSVLKIILTRGSAGRGYRYPEITHGTRILKAYPKPAYPSSVDMTGVKVRFCENRLGINLRLAGIKHLNRLEQVLARAEWHGELIREGLMLDYEGFLVEGIMSNVFLVQGEKVRTPLLDRCGVSGVQRRLVLEAAQNLGLTVEEARIQPHQVFSADEIFLTNSIIGVWPVSQLEGKAIPLGEIAKKLSVCVAEMAAIDMATQQAIFAKEASC